MRRGRKLTNPQLYSFHQRTDRTDAIDVPDVQSWEIMTGAISRLVEPGWVRKT